MRNFGEHGVSIRKVTNTIVRIGDQGAGDWGFFEADDLEESLPLWDAYLAAIEEARFAASAANRALFSSGSRELAEYDEKSAVAKAYSDWACSLSELDVDVVRAAIAAGAAVLDVDAAPEDEDEDEDEE